MRMCAFSVYVTHWFYEGEIGRVIVCGKLVY